VQSAVMFQMMQAAKFIPLWNSSGLEFINTFERAPSNHGIVDLMQSLSNSSFVAVKRMPNRWMSMDSQEFQKQQPYCLETHGETLQQSGTLRASISHTSAKITVYFVIMSSPMSSQILQKREACLNYASWSASRSRTRDNLEANHVPSFECSADASQSGICAPLSVSGECRLDNQNR